MSSKRMKFLGLLLLCCSASFGITRVRDLGGLGTGTLSRAARPEFLISGLARCVFATFRKVCLPSEAASPGAQILDQPR
jgi:hypothetical protein